MSRPEIIDRKTRSGAIYTSCLALRFPDTEIFELEKLLDSATEVENAIIASLDSELDSCSTTEATGDNEVEPCGQQSKIDTPYVPSSSSRPSRLNYQHWLRKQLHDNTIIENGYVPRQKTLNALLPKAFNSVQKFAFNFQDLPVTNGAYCSKVIKNSIPDEPLSLQGLKKLGIGVYEWNGVDPIPFVDQADRIFMVLAGRPRGEDYVKSCEEVYAAMEKEQANTTFTLHETSHRRGEYPIINVGVTHGIGTLKPTMLKNRSHGTVIERLLNNCHLKRVASFGSASFAIWAPKTHRYYKERLDLMFVKAPDLRRVFPKSVFPAATLNFGPKVFARKHKDSQNCPNGWCTVTPFGRYNPKTGGHLVIWELGIAIEFPPGSTILLPSAALFHSNATISEDERRASFTQYCSGGLFRWVDYGFQLEKDLKKSDPLRYQEVESLRSTKWKVGVDMFSTVTELSGLSTN